MSEATPVVGHLQTHKQGHVGHVVFNNPGKFNAVNYQMWCDLPVAMAQFAQDPGVRLIVLSGAGEKAFVSGADISQFDTQRTGGDAANTYNQASEAGYAAVLDCPKPTLAKIRGVCMGGGLGLALNCDVRICADDVRFRMPAGRLGLGYAFDGVKRFTEVVGVANTADLFTAPASLVPPTPCTWAWSSKSPHWASSMPWSMLTPPMCAKTRRSPWPLPSALCWSCAKTPQHVTWIASKPWSKLAS